MPTSFAITTTSGQVHLDSTRRATVSYTVTNRRGQECRGRVTPVPLEGAQPGWFQMHGQRERHFGVEETHHFTVEIAIPDDVPAGTYALRLDAVAEDNPDEDYAHGPAVAFVVPERAAPPPERTGYLRTVVGTGVGALAGLAAGGILGLLLGVIVGLIAGGAGFVVGIIIVLLVPWIGATLGSWQALRMGGYGRARNTGILVAGFFPVWEGLIVGIIALLDNIGLPGAAIAVVLLILAVTWITVPALLARFVALRLGGGQAAGTSNQPATT